MDKFEDYSIEYIRPNGEIDSIEMQTFSDEEVAHMFANGATGTEERFEVKVDFPDFLASVMPKVNKAVYTLLPGRFERRNTEFMD